MEKGTAINILREVHDNALFSVRTALETLAPELKESEDERIRRRIYRYIDVTLDDNETVEKEEWLAWLKEQKEFVSTNFEDVWEATDCEKLTIPLEKYSKDAIMRLCHAWYDKGIELERKKWKEKQGEQKPTDKVEQEYHCNGVREPKEATGVLKQLLNKEKYAWSEEDEELFTISLDNLIELNNRYGEEYGRVGECIRWLKSIKDRVKPLP